MDSPADHYDTLSRLPDSNDVNPQGLEKYLAMESEGPKYWFIVLNTNKSVERVFENDIIPVYKIERKKKLVLEYKKRHRKSNICQIIPGAKHK